MRLFVLLLICWWGSYDSFPLKTAIQSIRQQFMVQEARFRLFNRARVDSVIQLQNLDELIQQGPIPVSERAYLINGWRWHTLSVIHDLNRLISILESTKRQKEVNDNTMTRIHQSYNFLYKFNWNALKRVEVTVFFPWLKSMLPQSISKSVDKISVLHNRIEKLGGHFIREFESMKSASCTNRINHLDLLIKTLEQMIDSIEQIKTLQVILIMIETSSVFFSDNLCDGRRISLCH